MMKMRPYIVRQGEYLEKIAFMEGVDAKDAWKDARNARLEQDGRTPDIMASGDVLFLPDEAERAQPLQIGSGNEFQAVVPKTKVRVRFLHSDGKPYSNEPYVISYACHQEKGASHDDGTVNFEVSVLAREVDVCFEKQQAVFTVLVGALDPRSTASGKRQRLSNMGYGTHVGADGDEEEPSRNDELIDAHGA